MGKEDMSRKDRMVNTFLDTSADSMTAWGNEFLSTNIPKTMNWTVTKIKEVFSALANNSNVKSRDFIRNAILQGIEIGEANKERSLILAMKKLGIDEGRINQILEESNQFLVTMEKTDVE